MKTQQDRVLELLQQRKNIGITSQELRNITHIVDVPKAISLLRDKGYQITDKQEKLGNSFIKRYWLGNTTKESVEGIRGVDWDWDFSTGLARKVRLQPVQERAFV